MTEISVAERITLSFDDVPAYDKARLESVAKSARAAGIGCVSMGGGLAATEGWVYCSRLAGRHGHEWIADTKINDTPGRVAKTVENLRLLWTPPESITVHLTAGEEALRAAREAAGNTVQLLGVTVLHSLADDEVQRQYGEPVVEVVERLAQLAAATDLDGVVVPLQQVGLVKEDTKTMHLHTVVDMTDGFSNEGAIGTYAAKVASALRDGADRVVVGSPHLQAGSSGQAYHQLVQEVDGILAGYEPS